VSCVTRQIKRLGLRVSPAKSQVLGFYNSRHRGPPPPGLAVSISGERVIVEQQMKYLGLTIDSQWTFEPHFNQLVPKITTAANALCSLLPNLGGAGLGVREWYDHGSSTEPRYGRKN
jgi:hypothetical protein